MPIGEVITLEKFPDHLRTLKSKDWNHLFLLLPDIEKTSNFGQLKGGDIRADGAMTMPYWNPSEIIDKTVHAILNLKVCPIFDWMDWDKGKTILNDASFEYNQLESIELCKLFTVIIRADRFNDGYLISCFENGTMARIIKSLREKIVKADA